MPPVFVALVCALVCVPASADDPPKKLTPDERKDLEEQWQERVSTARQSYEQSKFAEATKSFEEALQVVRRLYPKAEYPDSHPNVADTLSNLGGLYWTLGRYAAAEPLLTECVEVRKRLNKGEHPHTA